MGVLCLFHPEDESPRAGWPIVWENIASGILKLASFTIPVNPDCAPVQADVDKTGHPVANPECLFPGVDNIVHWDFHCRSEIENLGHFDFHPCCCGPENLTEVLNVEASL